jgi:hypothetical protein
MSFLDGIGTLAGLNLLLAVFVVALVVCQSKLLAKLVIAVSGILVVAAIIHKALPATTQRSSPASLLAKISAVPVGPRLKVTFENTGNASLASISADVMFCPDGTDALEQKNCKAGTREPCGKNMFCPDKPGTIAPHGSESRKLRIPAPYVTAGGRFRIYALLNYTDETSKPHATVCKGGPPAKKPGDVTTTPQAFDVTCQDST